MHEIFERGRFQVLLRVFLQVDVDFDASLNRLAFVFRNGKVAIRLGLPHPLLRVVVVFRTHFNEIRDEVDRVETHTELANQRHVAALCHLVEKGGRSRLGDRPEVVFQVVLRHTHTLVTNRQNLAFLVRFDANVQFRGVTFAELRVIRERQEANLVQRIAPVGNQLA